MRNSVRRHLALERTFLAWLRTMVSLTGIGFVLLKFGITSPGFGGPVGPHSLAAGAFVLLGSAFLTITVTARYWLAARGRIEVADALSTRAVMVAALVLLVLDLAIVAIALFGRRA